MQKIHLIAIGGAVMHNLALALASNGYQISGSDDEINEPSYSRLKAKNLLPTSMGWNPELISTDLDAVILGMHARKDNPELQKAQRLGIKVYSFPEYMYEQAKNKLRVVIGGSHGKTTTTAMIMHVLKHCNIDFDYLVGSQLAGFETMVKISNAPLIILEGDEYLSSAIDPRPKFHLYQAQIALITGIAWDHINVFPTFENYLKQFEIFVDQIPAEGKLIYCANDELLSEICNATKVKAAKIPYKQLNAEVKQGKTFAQIGTFNHVPLQVFGNHNLQNMSGALEVCRALQISDALFMEAIKSFAGAARRMELLAKSDQLIIYRDFAHSPSKLKASVEAVKNQYPDKNVLACMELHTFSSLNEAFLKEYEGTMAKADQAIVYYSPQTIAHKKLKAISEQEVENAFAKDQLMVFTNSEQLQDYLKKKDLSNAVLLLMSSGNFGGINLPAFAQELAG